jgi:hypothetical protein
LCGIEIKIVFGGPEYCGGYCHEEESRRLSYISLIRDLARILRPLVTFAEQIFF